MNWFSVKKISQTSLAKFIITKKWPWGLFSHIHHQNHDIALFAPSLDGFQTNGSAKGLSSGTGLAPRKTQSRIDKEIQREGKI